jgi:creatinine amidohydrolase
MSEGARFELAALTTEEARAVCAAPPCAVLLPVGSVEPHGPHLPLATDTMISVEASRRAARALGSQGVAAYVAPSVAYGVTEYAAGFSGAIGVSAGVLTSLLGEIVRHLLRDGWSHVCLVNNHLEPAHDEAVRAAVMGIATGHASVACPLTRRWARTLSDEFKRGNCHAGRYETSLAMAADAQVRAEYARLPAVATSLSDQMRAGVTTFAAMGLDRAYTGAPAEASAAEGEALYDKLADMIVTEVIEGLTAAGTPPRT